MGDAVTESVRALVERGVTRLDLLEILLCLAGDPEHIWGTDALAEGARIDPKRTAEALSGLVRAGMVQKSRSVRSSASEHDRKPCQVAS